MLRGLYYLFFPDLRRKKVAHLPGEMLRFSGPSNYWRMMVTALLLLTISFGVLADILILLFNGGDPGDFYGGLFYVALLISLLMINRIIVAHKKNLHIHSVSFTKAGIKIKKNSTDISEVVHPVAHLSVLYIVFEEGMVFLFVNDEVKPLVTLITEEEVYRILPETLVQDVALCLGWSSSRPIHIEHTSYYALQPPKEARMVTIREDQLVNTSEEKEINHTLIRFFSIERQEGTLFRIRNSKQNEFARTVDIDKNSDQIVLYNSLLPDKHLRLQAVEGFAVGSIRKLRSRLFLKSRYFGELSIIHSDGRTQLLGVRVKKKGDGRMQRFWINEDLLQLGKQMNQICGL